MRTFGFIMNKNANTHEVRIPGERLARMNQSLKRRLDDDVEEVFHRACATNDFEAASDLLSLLEKWHARRAASYGRERRISGASLERARKELDRLAAWRAETAERQAKQAERTAKPGDPLPAG